eukprot:CAMPEP_0175869130 /NCGR_PEP_ID=MMETSP0107_2-20121207/35786_1 /TAXON_ID=195067 ORGANISM="Goniomonas pacifica, Strain CCMP1869" /NCGR_SAMPLE_ID=MMETSP0107_2 /ASSEMBLY_ACC=CAM_ASM_000203 /LENGTH=36 /DNA_ID= /DNA_START= /DNA_END= /DNA_ORIENTATION=
MRCGVEADKEWAGARVGLSHDRSEEGRRSERGGHRG